METIPSKPPILLNADFVGMYQRRLAEKERRIEWLEHDLQNQMRRTRELVIDNKTLEKKLNWHRTQNKKKRTHVEQAKLRRIRAKAAFRMRHINKLSTSEIALIFSISPSRAAQLIILGRNLK